MTAAAGTILVYSERTSLLPELLAAARPLADARGGAVCALAQGPLDPEETAAHLGAQGADRVLLVGADAHLESAASARVLAAAVERTKPELVLIAATREGTETAARAAQRLRLGCAHRCAAVRFEGDEVVVERGALGGFLTKEVFRTRPAAVTVAPHRFQPLAPAPGRRAETERLEVALPEPRIRVLARAPREASRVELEKARVVVSAGRGLRKADDLELVAGLASALGGELGGSRPLTDHLQWLAPDLKVGLSGRTVRPELYVACGISGQVEHLVGMRESKVIVAINLDPAAPIFAEADYAVVADLYSVVPALVQALRVERGAVEGG